MGQSCHVLQVGVTALASSWVIILDYHCLDFTLSTSRSSHLVDGSSITVCIDRASMASPTKGFKMLTKVSKPTGPEFCPPKKQMNPKASKESITMM